MTSDKPVYVNQAQHDHLGYTLMSINEGIWTEASWGVVVAGVCGAPCRCAQARAEGDRGAAAVTSRPLPAAGPGSLLVGQEETRRHRRADRVAAPGGIRWRTR